MHNYMAEGAEKVENHADVCTLPVIDLRLLCQDEICTIASLSRHDQYSKGHWNAMASISIDRSIFNESLGSHKQTYANMRGGGGLSQTKEDRVRRMGRRKGKGLPRENQYDIADRINGESQSLCLAKQPCSMPFRMSRNIDISLSRKKSQTMSNGFRDNSISSESCVDEIPIKVNSTAEEKEHSVNMIGKEGAMEEESTLVTLKRFRPSCMQESQESQAMEVNATRLCEHPTNDTQISTKYKDNQFIINENIMTDETGLCKGGNPPQGDIGASELLEYIWG